MSLEGNGGYNTGDYEFTRSFDDPGERDAAIKRRISERISNLGGVGLSRLFYTKAIISFGDGAYAQSDFLDDSPAQYSAVHDYVLYSGEHYERYRYVCSGMYFSLQALMLIGAAGYTLGKKKIGVRLVPHLSVFGIMLFLLFWEVSGRYATNFIPMIMLAAVSGADLIQSALTQPGLDLANNNNKC